MTAAPAWTALSIAGVSALASEQLTAMPSAPGRASCSTACACFCASSRRRRLDVDRHFDAVLRRQFLGRVLRSLVGGLEDGIALALGDDADGKLAILRRCDGSRDRENRDHGRDEIPPSFHFDSPFRVNLPRDDDHRIARSKFRQAAGLEVLAEAVDRDGEDDRDTHDDHRVLLIHLDDLVADFQRQRDRVIDELDDERTEDRAQAPSRARRTNSPRPPPPRPRPSARTHSPVFVAADL